MKPITLVSGALLGAALLALPAAAQRSEAQARSDIAFARGLASKWQFIDLAEQVMLDLERAGVGRTMAEELGLVKCDIYAEGAKKESDVEARDELYTKAVDAYKAYIDQNPFSEHLPRAERSYVDICNAYGRNLERRYADAVGDEAIEIRDRLHEVLEEALRRTGDLIAALVSIDADDRTVAQKTELKRVMFNRGQMLHSMAKVSDEGAFFFSQAEQVLEDLALLAGEKTPQGLFAFLELSRVHASQGNWASSADFAQYVVNAVIPIEESGRAEGGWNDLTPEQKAQRWLFVEWGTEPLTEAYLQQGEAEDACRWALHFYNTWKREGFALSRPSGYMALLAGARTLLSTGGHVGGSLTSGRLKWYESQEAIRAEESSSRNRRTSLDLALSIAQNVNQDNRGNTLQIRAQKLISDVIDRPGVTVAPDVLFEAAQGEYFNKDYLVAIDSFKRVMRSLDAQDEATRQEYGAKVLYHLAESHRKLQRPLEAAMAYREGVSVWRGDPEFDDKNARGFYGSISEVRRNLKGVKEIEDLYREAEQIRIKVEKGDVGDIVFRQAMRAYDQGDYAPAREKLLEVEQKANTYEKALTYAALCLHKLKDLDSAEAEFQAYLNYMRDPRNAIVGDRKATTRSEATAMARPLFRRHPLRFPSHSA